LTAKQRVLVTGAGGFIGRWSIDPLLAAGYEVHAVLSPTSRTTDWAPPLLRPDVAVRRADLLELAAIDALIDAVRPSHLLHFAWIATPGLYGQSAENYRWLTAGQHLMQSFQRQGGVRAVMAGSCAEYDWSRVEICNERTSPLMIEPGAADTPAADAAGILTPYAACKIAMQRSLEEFGRATGLSAAWGRIFFQYGPGEHRDRLVASAIINLLSGREAPCTHGRQIRSFLHVADVGAAFATLLGSEVEGAVNVGSGDRISIADLLEQVARQTGRPDLLKLGARRAPPGEPPVLLPDIGRLRDEVGFRPSWRLDAGLADTIRWWRRALAEAGAAP
jgi:nucleoside-diphosphate-sugar epimerase